MKKMVVLSSLLMLGGCIDWEPGSVAHVLIEEEGFSAQQIQMIHEGIEEWEVSLNQYVHFEYVDSKGYNNLIVIRASDQKHIATDSDPHRIAVTYTIPWSCGGGIYLSRDVAPKLFTKNIRHEVGHALGLSHDPRVNTIMYHATLPSAQHVTCRDVEQFCRDFGCAAEEMPICQ